MYSVVVFSLSVILISQLENPTLAFGTDFICESSTELGMTNKQVQMCWNYSQLMLSLFNDTLNKFRSHCYSQFKHERWNCRDVIPPIFGARQSPFLSLHTKEAAFVHALASAAVVHTVAEKCAKSNGLPYCGCLKLNNECLPADEVWEGCSPDMNFGLSFAENFLDSRESNAPLKHKVFALHNNQVGREVVQDYMRKTCTCVGNGQDCSRGKHCKLVLPTMTKVAGKLKKLYEQSVYSTIRISSEVTKIIIVDRETGQRVSPCKIQRVSPCKIQRVSPCKMIHFSPSPDYCMANSDYNITGIEGRECTLKDSSSSQHCDNLCCDHGYENVTISEKTSCNCKFVWCCRVECDACNITRINHRCKAEPETSSTSHIGHDLQLNYG